MTTFSLHALSDVEFALALRGDLWARDLDATTAAVAAGKHAYRTLNGAGEDRGNTVLPAVGWIGLRLDESLGDWDARIVERTDR